MISKECFFASSGTCQSIADGKVTDAFHWFYNAAPESDLNSILSNILIGYCLPCFEVDKDYWLDKKRIAKSRFKYMGSFDYKNAIKLSILI